MDPKLKAKLQKQRYHIVGEHGGVKTCHWTKNLSFEEGSVTKAGFMELKVTDACKCRLWLTNVIWLAPIVGENLTWTH